MLLIIFNLQINTKDINAIFVTVPSLRNYQIAQEGEDELIWGQDSKKNGMKTITGAHRKEGTKLVG